MAVHFLHTSDWHLGQFFHNHDREFEHAQFLHWLLEQIRLKQPNALLIAGDIFDVINPASSAQKQLYQFLADAHTLAPHMQTLMIAGNHDSGYRIEQVEPFLAKFNAKAVGVISRNDDNQLNLDRLLIPIYDQSKEIIAWCLTLPYLRSAEITGLNEHTTNNQNAIAYLHQQLIAEAKARKQPHQALILMSHAHMQGGETSDSERPIVVGNEEALSTALFDEVIDYVALGHLHKPQKVGQENIRYSGSPIPLSFSERNYKHQVIEVKIDPKRKEDIFSFESLIIPRTVDLIRITCELSSLIKTLHALPDGEIMELSARHFIEIEYTTDAPPPVDLRQQIEQALPPNRYRLLRIGRLYPKVDNENQDSGSKIDLAPPTPESLFLRMWEKKGYSEDKAVKQDFLQLLHEAQDALDQDQ